MGHCNMQTHVSGLDQLWTRSQPCAYLFVASFCTSAIVKNVDKNVLLRL